jgi:hypothetical protein
MPINGTDRSGFRREWFSGAAGRKLAVARARKQMSEARIDAGRGKRDAFGWACFILHFAVMIFVVVGWSLPFRAVLVFYLFFVPAVTLQWQFNRNSCVLNNLESLMRTGRWRDPGNPEEGAWLLTLARSVLGWNIRPAHMDVFLYLVMTLLWGLGLVHFLRL